MVYNEKVEDEGSWLLIADHGLPLFQRCCALCGEHYLVERWEVAEAKSENLTRLASRCHGHRTEKAEARYLENHGGPFELARGPGLIFLQRF